MAGTFRKTGREVMILVVGRRVLDSIAGQGVSSRSTGADATIRVQSSREKGGQG